MKLVLVASLSFLLFYLYITNNMIRFSVPSGFYEEGFHLEIKAPGSQIYYTLDGSDPTKDSIRYTEPIYMIDASNNENIYADRNDVSTCFLEELIIAYTGDDNYQCNYKIPDYLVDKGIIMKVVYYNVLGIKSEIETLTYFIGFEEKTGYDNYNTISIVTNPDNLFDDNMGIYVLGTAFANYMENGFISEEYGLWDSNYRRSGSAWEREADIFLFDQEGNVTLQKEVGIRIQGGWSRANVSKSLNVYARNQYDGTEQINYSIWESFDSEYRADAFTIASGGQDDYTKLKDRLVSELCNTLNVATMNYEPYNMFLNGEYWGVYHLAEKYTDTYFQYYYQVIPTDITLVKGGELEIGEERDYQLFVELRRFLEDEELDLSQEDQYEYIWTQIDKTSTIDYFALKLYFGRTGDWIPLGHNSALWKTTYVGDGAYEDGLWRWAVYDMNSLGINGTNNNVDPIEHTRNISVFFNNLCKNQDFVTLLFDRLLELMETDFQEERIFTLIDDYTVEMEDAMANHYKRFFGGDLTVFYEQMEDIRTFFDGRNENMRRFIDENFGTVMN